MGQLLFSIVLGLLGLALDFPDMIEAGKLVFKLMKEYDYLEVQDESFNDGQDSFGSQGSSAAQIKLAAQCKEQLWRVRVIFIRYCCYMFVYFGLLLYTVVKVVGFFL